jgi:hypothetical protein
MAFTCKTSFYQRIDSDVSAIRECFVDRRDIDRLELDPSRVLEAAHLRKALYEWHLTALESGANRVTSMSSLAASTCGLAL